MDIERVYQEWLSSPRVSESDKETLRQMDDFTKKDAFFKDAEFGTGGMRGILGPGTNRINIQNLGRVTVGFGQYLADLAPDAKQRGVVISHDNRFMSREFTLEFANILNQMGFNVYIFDALRPTPELSFAVRAKKAIGGIMVTASHNPANNNGYKVYDENGCQLVPADAAVLLGYISKLPDALHYEVPQDPNPGKTTVLSEEIDGPYIQAVESIQIRPELDKSDFSLVYSPQHGASYESAMRVFKDCGYNVIPVAEQCIHDPAFGATLSPNPEVEKAWILPLEYARKYHSDLVVMTDPDGDRCGLAYLGKDGEYHRLTGNQSGALLIDYVLAGRKEKGTLPANGVIYDTIVTSNLGSIVAKSYGVATESFLTGFKFIGDRIHYYEKQGHGPEFLFGYEESYGCLLAPFVRDKDGVQAILMYTEMTLYYKSLGMDLGQAWQRLQQKHGFHYATLRDVYFEGMEGNAKMKAMMEGLRENPLKEIDGVPVVEIRDYQKQIALKDGKEEKMDHLPKSNVLKYFLEDGSTICVRPSGTEPKVKFYLEAVGQSEDGLEEKTSRFNVAMRKLAGID